MTAAVNKQTTNVALAKLFINFVGRPKQGGLYAKIGGGLTADELKNGNMGPELAPRGSLLKQKRTVLLPNVTWPNGSCGGKLNT